MLTNNPGTFSFDVSPAAGASIGGLRPFPIQFPDAWYVYNRLTETSPLIPVYMQGLLFLL